MNPFTSSHTFFIFLQTRRLAVLERQEQVKSNHQPIWTFISSSLAHIRQVQSPVLVIAHKGTYPILLLILLAFRKKIKHMLITENTILQYKPITKTTSVNVASKKSQCYCCAGQMQNNIKHTLL